MRPYVVSVVLVVACNSNSGTGTTLRGISSFIPNAVFVERFHLHDGGILQNVAQIRIEQTIPPDSCAFVDAGPPDGGLAYGGGVQVMIAGTNGLLNTGDYTVVTSAGFFAAESNPTENLALVQVMETTDPPSTHVFGTETSVSGTLTLTNSGGAWSGKFLAVISLVDGGEGQLSGTFDTGSTCVGP